MRAEGVVDQRLLMQRHSNTSHHATDDLATSRLGIEDTARGHCIDDAGHADDTDLLVDLHFDEDRRMRVAGKPADIRESVILASLDALDLAVTHDIGNRRRTSSVSTSSKFAVG